MNAQEVAPTRDLSSIWSQPCDLSSPMSYLRLETLNQDGHQQIKKYVVPKSHKSYEIQGGAGRGGNHAVVQHHIPVLLSQDLQDVNTWISNILHLLKKLRLDNTAESRKHFALPGRQWRWPTAGSQSSSCQVRCRLLLSSNWTYSQICASPEYYNTIQDEFSRCSRLSKDFNFTLERL